MRTGALAVALAVSACSGSDANGPAAQVRGDPGVLDGAVGQDTAGAALAHEYNQLVKLAYDARCKVCTCKGFSPSSAQAEACAGAVYDEYPAAKTQMICDIDIWKADVRCLDIASDCDAADTCDSTRTADIARCPVFDQNMVMGPLPAPCQGLVNQ